MYCDDEDDAGKDGQAGGHHDNGEDDFENDNSIFRFCYWRKAMTVIQIARNEDDTCNDTWGWYL